MRQHTTYKTVPSLVFRSPFRPFTQCLPQGHQQRYVRDEPHASDVDASEQSEAELSVCGVRGGRHLGGRQSAVGDARCLDGAGAVGIRGRKY